MKGYTQRSARYRYDQKQNHGQPLSATTTTPTAATTTRHYLPEGASIILLYVHSHYCQSGAFYIYFSRHLWSCHTKE